MKGQSHEICINFLLNRLLNLYFICGPFVVFIFKFIKFILKVIKLLLCTSMKMFTDCLILLKDAGVLKIIFYRSLMVLKATGYKVRKLKNKNNMLFFIFGKMYCRT